MNEGYTSLLLLLISVVHGADTSSCKNGGFPRADGTCNCPAYWDGKACDELKCANGGYISNGVCFCPLGYHGVHCEATLTLAAPLNGFKTERSFNVFIFNPVSVYYGGMALRGLRDAINFDENINAGFYEKFTLQIANDDEGKETEPEAFDDYEKFLETMNDKLNTDLQPKTYSCYDINLYSRLIKQITKNHLMYTVLTVFTQHPAKAANDEYEELLRIAISFGVQINILFSHDENMIECVLNNGEFPNMRELAEKSGGNFVVLNRDNPGVMANVFIALHADQQQVKYAESSHCNSGLLLSDIKLEANLLQYTVIVKAEDENAALECTSESGETFAELGVTLIKIETGESEIKLYTFTTEANHSAYECTLTYNGPCEMKLVSSTNASSAPSGLKLFNSFVESEKLDSSNAFLIEGAKLFTSLHLELASDAYAATFTNLSFEITKFSLKSEGKQQNSTLRKREKKSSFEFISSEAFKCEGGKKHWLELEIAAVQNNETVTTMQRYIPVECYSHRNPQIMATAGSVSMAEVTKVATMVTKDTVTARTEVLEQCKIFKDHYKPQATLMVAYSNGLNQTQFIQFASTFRDISVRTAISSYYQNFGSILFDAGKRQGKWEITDEYQEFVLGMKDTTEGGSGTDTNIVEVLKEALKHKDMRDSSTLLIVASRFCNESVDPEIIGLLTSRRIRVIVLFMYAQYGKKLRSNKFYEDLTVITNGHYIVMNELSVDKDEATQTIIQTVTKRLLFKAASQDLILTKNYEPTGNEDEVGIVDFSGLPGNQKVPLYLTVSMSLLEDADGELEHLPLKVKLRIQVINMEDGSSDDSEDKFDIEANIWWKSLELKGGVKYKIVLSYTGLPGRQAAVRLWRQRKGDTAGLEYKFVGSTKAKIGQDLSYPNAAEGAVMRATYHAGQNSEVLADAGVQVEYTDCSGDEVTIVNAAQSAKISKGDGCFDAYFLPFFCEHKKKKKEKCLGLSEEMANIYNVKVSLSNANGVFRQYHNSFYCAQPTNSECEHHMTKTEDKCDCVTHTDKTDSGYYTGPLCQLDDCNGNGALQYINDTLYECNCREGFKGQFCEEGYCRTLNEEPGIIDGHYRTLTVVIDVSDDVNITLIKDVFSQENISSTIWLFHLVAYNNESEISLYLGRDIVDFINSFDLVSTSLPSQSGYHHIPSPETLYHALQPTGSEIRGVLFVFLSTSPSLEMPNEALEYYRVLHPYTKLQVYFAMNLYEAEIDPPAFASLAELSEATGGALLDFDGKILSKLISDTMENKVTVNEIGKMSEEINLVNFTVESQALILVTATNSSATVKISSQNHVTPVESDSLFTHAFTIEPELISDYTVTIADCDDPCEARVSVFSINGFTPTVNFIEYLNDDKMTALPVNTSLPKIMVHGCSDKYTVDDYSNVNIVYRNRNCTFEVTDEVKTVDGSLGDFAKVGGRQIELKLSTVADKPQDVYEVKKTVPFIVSDKTECVNSKDSSVKNMKCECHDGYEGPDCRRIICENGGKLNAFKTACLCDSLLFFGEHCEKQNELTA